MTWRSVFLILTVCFFNLCHRCSALWVDTTHNQQALLYSKQPGRYLQIWRYERRKFPLLQSERGWKLYTRLCKMWSKQCIIYAADRTRSENSQKRANRCWMAGSLQGKKKENEREGWWRQPNKLLERKENNKIMQEWGKKGELEAKAMWNTARTSPNNLQLQSASTWGQ